MEMAAPSSTPLTGPDPSTLSSAAMATKNSAAEVPMAERADVDQAHHRASTMAASTGCGRLRSRPVAKSTTISATAWRPGPTPACAPWSFLFTSDATCRRHGSRPSPERFAGAERQQLLAGVEPVAVLWPNMRPIADVRRRRARSSPAPRERARSARAADVAEGGRPAHIAQQRHAARRDRRRGRQDAGDRRGTGSVDLQPELAGDEHGQGGG